MGQKWEVEEIGGREGEPDRRGATHCRQTSSWALSSACEYVYGSSASSAKVSSPATHTRAARLGAVPVAETVWERWKRWEVSCRFAGNWGLWLRLHQWRCLRRLARTARGAFCVTVSLNIGCRVQPAAYGARAKHAHGAHAGTRKAAAGRQALLQTDRSPARSRISTSKRCGCPLPQQPAAAATQRRACGSRRKPIAIAT